MAEPLKINDPNEISLICNRTVLSKLWFVNNPSIENEVIGYLAKYQKDYGAILYGFILMGNHYHMIARFPRGNRHDFMRVFNRIFANILGRHSSDYEGGSVWKGRYRPQALLTPDDVTHWFYYLALNPISSGLVESIEDYYMFNSYSLSLQGGKKAYSLINWEDYKNRKRYNQNLRPEDCIEEYELTFSRLPGHEEESEEEYCNYLEKECVKRSAEKVEFRKSQGEGFLGANQLQETPEGARPLQTKTTGRYGYRPLALSLNSEKLAIYLKGYFSIVEMHRMSSIEYRSGNKSIIFPHGTFRPPVNID